MAVMNRFPRVRCAHKNNAEEGASAPRRRKRGRAGRLLAVVLGAALAVSLTGCGETPDPRGIREGAGHFQREGATPELSGEGVKCVIAEAYYTNDGGLMLKLKLSNGTDVNRRLQTLDITLKNEDDEEIAVAATDQFDESFYVPAGGYGDMSFYISSEYLKKSDDDLDKLTYEISTTSDEFGAATSNMSE